MRMCFVHSDILPKFLLLSFLNKGELFDLTCVKDLGVFIHDRFLYTFRW